MTEILIWRCTDCLGAIFFKHFELYLTRESTPVCRWEMDSSSWSQKGHAAANLGEPNDQQSSPGSLPPSRRRISSSSVPSTPSIAATAGGQPFLQRTQGRQVLQNTCLPLSSATSAGPRIWRSSTADRIWNRCKLYHTPSVLPCRQFTIERYACARCQDSGSKQNNHFPIGIYIRSTLILPLLALSGHHLPPCGTAVTFRHSNSFWQPMQQLIIQN